MKKNDTSKSKCINEEFGETQEYKKMIANKIIPNPT